MATQVKEKKKTGKRGKKALKVLGIILGALIVITGILTVVNVIGNKGNDTLAQSFEAVDYENQLIPQKDTDGNWCFVTDEDLKVVQLTDVHIGGGFLSFAKDSSALTAVATILTAEKPDLVIVTGDVAYPVPFQSGTFNNKTGARIFADLMETLGVYWTLGYGNHDTEAYSFYNREEISDFYMNSGYDYCLFQKGDDAVDGCGNQTIKVKNSAGLISQVLYVFDSHSYTDGDYFGAQWKYDNIHENQVEWYKQCVAAFNAENAAVLKDMDEEDLPENIENFTQIKSLAFFHIPLTEYKDAWTQFAENGYEDTDEVTYRYGMVGETGKCIYCGINDDNVFETFSELGSTKAVFCGHDHFNNFSLNYKGIDLTYGYSIDYLAYIGINKKGSQRGATVIEVHPDGTYDFNGYNLYTSGRYELPAGFADDIYYQFEDVTYQYIKEEN